MYKWELKQQVVLKLLENGEYKQFIDMSEENLKAIANDFDLDLNTTEGQQHASGLAIGLALDIVAGRIVEVLTSQGTK